MYSVSPYFHSNLTISCLLFINLYFSLMYVTLYTWIYGACLCVCPAQALEAIRQATMLALSFHLWWDLVFVFLPLHWSGYLIYEPHGNVCLCFLFFYMIFGIRDVHATMTGLIYALGVETQILTLWSNAFPAELSSFFSSFWTGMFHLFARVVVSILWTFK